MKKKKSSGGGANWMDTYGDMVTLLLCFFVLLYSMSTISEEKWRAIVTSFNPNAELTPTENSGNDGPLAEEIENPGQDSLEYLQEGIEDIIMALFQQLQQYTASEGMDSVVQVDMDGGLIYVKLSDSALFDGESYKLKPEAEEILRGVCAMLDESADAIEEVRVLGHTAQGSPRERNEVHYDRRLASNRATEVVIFLQENSAIHPARLISEGYGQWHPISSNATATSRAFNRRVEIIISGRDLAAEAEGGGIQSYIAQDEADMSQYQ